MKTFKFAVVIMVSLSNSENTVQAQAPIITSFSQNGTLECRKLEPGTLASVEWAPTLDGPWTNNWAGLNAVVVASNGTINVCVPMFYRVRGVPWPTNMSLIPAGPFFMGDVKYEYGGNEFPVHYVYVSGFYMDQYEVTKELWDEVYLWATNHGYSFEYGALGKTNNHPAYGVTWYDAAKWCNARSEKEGKTPAYYTIPGNVYRSGEENLLPEYVMWRTGYRLPTEAEWEKAARGGASWHRFPWSDSDTIQHARANYYSRTNYVYDTSSTRGYHPIFNDGVGPYTSPVGYFAPNEYELYDMSGNVVEWCWDWYSSYSSSPQSNPSGPAWSTGARVQRGGNYGMFAFMCRAAWRGYSSPGSWLDGGFRCVLPAGP